MEPKVIECTVCGKKMKIPPTHFGKKIKCPGCTSLLVIGADGMLAKAVPAEGAAPAPAAAAKPTSAKNPKTASKPAAAASEKAAAAKVKTASKPAAAVADKAAAAKAAPAAKAGAAAKAVAAAKTAEKADDGKTHAAPKKGEMKVHGNLHKPGLTPAMKVNKIEKGVKAGVKVAKFERSAKDRAAMLDTDKEARKLWTLLIGIFVIIGLGGTVAYIVLTPPNDGEVITPIDLPKEVKMNPGDIVTIEGEKVQLYVRSTDKMEFVKIPGKSYKVGLPSDGSAATSLPEETPEFEVEVGEYYIGRNEVTNNEYTKFLQFLSDMRYTKHAYEKEGELHAERNPEYSKQMFDKAKIYEETIFDHPLQPPTKSKHSPTDMGTRVGDRPCTNIDWFDAYAYCNWANGMDPTRGILPTELEWEIAARGPAMDLYPWGEGIMDLRRRVTGKDEREDGIPESEKKARVDLLNKVSFEAMLQEAVKFGNFGMPSIPENPNSWANKFGLRNIAGNAAEWCWDRYADKLYVFASENTGTTTFAPELSKEAFEKFGALDNKRAVRLSSVQVPDPDRNPNMTETRYTRRGGYAPTDKWPTIGFRCVYYENRPAPYATELASVNEAHQEVVAMSDAIAAKRVEIEKQMRAEAAPQLEKGEIDEDALRSRIFDAVAEAADRVQKEFRAGFKLPGHMWFESLR